MRFFIVALALLVLVTPAYATSLKCFPELISNSIYPGDTFYETITLWQEDGNNTFIVDFTGDSETPQIEMNFVKRSVMIPTTPLTNYTTLIVATNPNLAERLYTGTIHVSENGNEYCSIPIRLNITKKVQISTNITLRGNTVDLGETFMAVISMKKISGPPGLMTVYLTYRLKDPNEDVVDSKEIRIAFEDSKDYEYSFNIPLDAKDGEWSFEVDVARVNFLETKNVNFQVVKSKNFFVSEESARVLFLALSSIAILIASIGGVYLSIRNHQKNIFLNKFKDHKKELLNKIKVK